MRIRPTDIDPTGGTNGQVLGLVSGVPAWIDQTGGGGGGGGGANWTLAGSVTITTPVANIDFVDLDGANEILVLVGKLAGVTTSVSAIRQVLFSTDNGVSFFNASGEYRQINTNGTLTAISAAASHITNASVGRSVFCHLRNARTLNCPKVSITNNGNTMFVADDANAVNAIRVSATSGADLTGGDVLVYVR